MRIALNSIIPRTTTNGPGARFGMWVQGCPRRCKGCFNPGMLPTLPDDAPGFEPPNTPGWIHIETLMQLIEEEHSRSPLEGISVSGGEPFDQPGAMRHLCELVQAMGLSVLVFTGYALEELLEKPATKGFFEPAPVVDILIDGPYDRSRQVEGEIRGSANQHIRLLTDRYCEGDLTPPGTLECIVRRDGSIAFTGLCRPPFDE